MKRYLVVLIIAVLFVSCGHKKEKIPQSNIILNKKEMTEVLVDVYIAEAALVATMQDGNTAKAYTNLYYNYIFKKHNITRSTYLSNLHYYSFRLKEMKEIYTDVMIKLISMQVKKKRVAVDEN